MKIPNKGEKFRVNLQPGDYYVTNQRVILSTLLGSCVSACLYDPIKKIVGMNHFLLTRHLENKNTSSVLINPGRYGEYAMELMMNKMFEHGAMKQNLKAKAFGGANLYNFSQKRKTSELVGNANVQFLKEYLELERIPLVSYDLNGTKGRVIYFSSIDYSVYVRTIQNAEVNGIVQKEVQLLESQRHSQKEQAGKVDLWNR